jgi:cytochrome oxidase Cu insertion factor (SCO1/SenC/PrrC family)
VRKLAALAVFAVVAAACGGGTSTTQAGQAPPAPSSPAELSATTKPPVDGPLAPDFTLTLADGSMFTLSQEQKPVYIIFWAEW